MRIPPPAHPQILDYDPVVPPKPQWQPHRSLEEVAASTGMTPAEIAAMLRARYGKISEAVPLR